MLLDLPRKDVAGIAYNWWGKGTRFEKHESAKIRTALLQILLLLFSQEHSSWVQNPFLYMRIGTGPYFATSREVVSLLGVMFPGLVTS